MSKTLCAAPWKVLHLSPQGNVYSCYESSTSLGNIYESSLEKIWHNQAFQKLRDDMLKGHTVSQCEKCYQKEKVLNGKSLRTQLNYELGDKDLIAIDPPLQPVYLDLALSNTCNLKCRICGPYYSSSWLQETEKEAKANYKLRAINESMRSEQIETLITPRLERVVLAGGEPLLERQNDEVLKKIIELEFFDVQIEYNTNATSLRQETLKLWSSFKNIKCNFSLDDFGSQFEYLRKGAKWSEAVGTIQSIRSSASHVQLSSYATINIFNVLDYPLLVRELVALKLFKISEIHLHYLVDPDYLNIQVLPLDVKKQVEKDYYDFIKSYLLKNYDYKDVENMILQMKMVINYMNEADRSGLLDKFRDVTEGIDQKRGEDYRLLFPHLAK